MVTQTGKAVLKRMATGQKPNRGVPTIANAPAGGTGATAGAYDNATNRDAMIATLNGIANQLRALGIIN